MSIFAHKAWLPDGWSSNTRVTIDKSGHVSRIEKNSAAHADDVTVDTLLPALANLHSHSFQRGMAGMTEFKAAKKDSFWTWRNLMYQFLQHLTPEHVEAIAGLVFMEMLEAGYASVGEFHYVHHQPGGIHYDNKAELSLRIINAAQDVGIGLTLLPVLYTYGGTGKQGLSDGQLRFGNTAEQFVSHVQSVIPAVDKARPDTRLGIAPHSLRATTPEDLKMVLSQFPQMQVHMHVAEQPKEVEDVKSWLGARPVEWLLSNADVNQNWCIIHATQMTEQETIALAESGAVVGLCPITEANLGDGPFNGPEYFAQKGAFGVGSDSNVRISLTEELRTLEYSQRLRDLRRNVLVEVEGSVGQALYLGAAKGGAQALNRKSGQITEGFLADFTAVDTSHQYLCALNNNQLFDGLCFAADDRVVTDVWSAGQHVVANGKHKNREHIISKYKNAMSDLRRLLSD